jgi:hypothetical protein
MLVAASPALAQAPSSVPPQGVPAVSQAQPKTREALREEALTSVRKAKERLAQVEVPVDLEPAFTFGV